MKKQLLITLLFLTSAFGSYDLVLPRGERIELQDLQEVLSVCEKGECFSVTFIEGEDEETALERMKILFATEEWRGELWHLVYVNDPYDILFEISSSNSDTPSHLVRLLNVRGGFLRFDYSSADHSNREEWLHKLNALSVVKK